MQTVRRQTLRAGLPLKGASVPLSGIDLSTIDASVRPQDDLYQYVNGRWLNTTVIPDDRPLEGTFTALRDASELAVKEIIEQAAARGAEATGIERKIGDLYNSFMDEAAVEAKGLDPLRSRLAEVFATTSVAELVALAGRLFRADVSGLFYIYPAPDAGNPDRILLYTGQGGLGLPDESYYREEKFAPMVQAYRDHVQTMLGLADVGDPAGAASLLDAEPLATWQEWLAMRVGSSAAPYLSSAFVDANFAFYGTTLSGTPRIKDRWKRGVAVVEAALGEAVGQIYVAEHFPEGHKARMQTLVANLIEAYRESITGLTWMGEDTKAEALRKLGAFRAKIGF